MAALGTFVPGHYAMTYNGTSVGIIEYTNYGLRGRFSEQPLNNSSQYGDTLFDSVYRGWNWTLMVTFREWSATTKSVFGLWTGAALNGTLGLIGQLGTGVAKQIVLTPQALSPAAVNAGGTFTAAQAKLSAANDITFLLGPINRDVPVLFDLLPYDDAGTIRHYTIT